MLSSVPTEQPSLKVPKENNRYLCWPAANDAKLLLTRNRGIFAQGSLPQWFRQLRTLAREQALSSSKSYMSAYAPTLAQSISLTDVESKQLVLGGHQPELFHSGVWFKNFLLGEIGERTNSLGIQVIIDHDVAKSDTLRVPTCPSWNTTIRTSPEFAQRSIPLPIRNESHPRMPWHATLTGQLHPTAWDKTVEVIQQSLAACGLGQPLIQSHYKMLTQSIQENKNIGDAFSQFRHRIEMDNGIFNLEVPIGLLCDRSAFGFFVLHCVQNAESLWGSYNRCREAYRQRHRIRNQAQPVLELQRSNEWLELPFWIYRAKGERFVERKRLWVRYQKDPMLLTDHVDPNLRTVSVELPMSEQALPAAWDALVQNGICIRPRALMTTMYLRCFVADLFVHGIGGGTYDELTDDIVRDWLGMDPPTYLTSSASLHLPLRANAGIEQINPSASDQSIQRELQLMRSVPERFLDTSIDSQRALFDLHARHITDIPQRGRKRKWHHEIALIKQQITAAIEPKKQAAYARREIMQHDIQQNKVLKFREYSFVLFEEQDVVGRLSKLAKAAFSQGTEAGK